MAGDERNFHAGEFFRHRARLFGIAGIIADFQLELLAEDAARGVDVGDGLFGAIAELPPEAGFAARHRAGDADREILSQSRTGEREARAQRKSDQTQRFHAVLPVMRTADDTPNYRAAFWRVFGRSHPENELFAPDVSSLRSRQVSGPVRSYSQ